MEWDGAPVVADKQGFVTVLTLNRDAYRNALSQEIVDALLRQLAIARENDSRVVVLRARGRAFCAGAKLDELVATADGPDARRRQMSARRLFSDLVTFPKPTIAVVQGPAVAGGAGLATACDFVIAAADVYFAYPEVNIAAAPSMVMQILLRRVPWRVGTAWCMLGRKVPAGEAKDYGLINEVVPSDQLEEVGRNLAELLANKNPDALAIIKEMALVGPEMTLRNSLDYAATMTALISVSDANRESAKHVLSHNDPK